MIVFLWFVVGLILYLAIGTGWAFWRWRRFVRGEIAYYELERLRFIRFHRLHGPEIPEFLKAEWRHYVEAHVRLKDVPPRHEEYTTRLALNLFLWPVSIASLVGQFIYKA